MLPEATMQLYIQTALTTAANAASFKTACSITPNFVYTLSHNLEQRNLENKMFSHSDKPFIEIQVNLIEEKWQEEFWWGQAYLSIKISQLAPVFTCEKVMIQLDHSKDVSEVNSWQHLSREREAITMGIVNSVATNAGYQRLKDELSQDVDTGPLLLNAHYRKWKPTIYAVFFEKITEQ